MVGTSSKVDLLLTTGLNMQKMQSLNLDDTLEWESKTITSAVKTYFRNLSESLLTFDLYKAFIEAASE